MDNGGTPAAQKAVERVINDPYTKHLVELIVSGRFTEPLAAASLQEELTEHMSDLIGEGAMYDAYWA